MLDDYKTSIIYPNIVAYDRKDINGDGIPENIYLTGIETPDSPYIQNISLVIQDSITGKVTNVPLEENDGYDPRLILGDFTGNGVNDILIGINSGGSGGMMYYYIFTFTQNTPQLIFDVKVFNNAFQYNVIYKDFYTVEVISEVNNTSYLLDISNKGSGYLNEIYDENGKLKAPLYGFVNPLSGMYPIDYNSDNKFELLTYQKIAGQYNADTLGYVQNILSWHNREFLLEDQYVAILGQTFNTGFPQY